MITPEGFDDFGNAILSRFDTALINVDGADVQFDIYRKWMEGKRLIVYLLLSNTTGILKDFRLLNPLGTVVISEVDEVEKTETNGYLISFQLDMVEVFK